VYITIGNSLLQVNKRVHVLFDRAMFTDGLLECKLDEIRLNGVTAIGMKALIDFAYSSKVDIDAGRLSTSLRGQMGMESVFNRNNKHTFCTP